MSLSKGVGSVIVSIIVLLLIITGVIVAVKILGHDAPIKPMIIDAIELRKVDDSVKKAQMITELDDLVQQADNAKLSDLWLAMTDCLGSACTDDTYFEFVVTVIMEYEDIIPHSNLLINLISTNRYWGTDNVVEFSKAMTYADEAIQEFSSRNVGKTWDAIVECAGVCPEKNDLFFELIEMIVLG